MSTDEQKTDVVAWKGVGPDGVSDVTLDRATAVQWDEDGIEVTRLYDATTITALQERIKELEGALSECQRALATLIAPEAIQATTVINAFAQVTAAEWAARSTLKDSGNG
jgi:hypothetical protein